MLKLTWKALKQTSSASIQLTSVQIANSAGVESSLNSVTHQVQVTGSNELNKEALNALIAESQATLQAAVEGSAPGQYPTGAKATLQAAINAAIAVAANAVTQDAIDQATSTLNQALQAFTNSVNTSPSGDVNGDGKVTVGDIAIAAASYGKTDASPDWNLIKKFDYVKDGIIDIKDLAVIARAMFE